MPNVYQLAGRFRKELEERQDNAVRQLLAGYGRAWTSVEGEITALTRTIAQAQAEGRPALVPLVAGGRSAWDQGGYPQSLEWQRQRLRIIQDRLAQAIAAVEADADMIIRTQQADAITAGRRHALSMMGQAVDDATPGLTATFNQPNLAPLLSQVGFLADGTPLNRLLAQLGPDAVESVTTALVEGMAVGRHPNIVARQMQKALGGSAARARLIARTEMLRSYRESTRVTYEANDDVVSGWVWHSAKGALTCATCWAMHGTVFEVQEPLGSHPNCRCSMVPRTKTWEELGFSGLKDTNPDIRPGPDDFRVASEATKRAVLGPGKYEAYKAGDIDLPDLVKTTDHPDWGTNRTVASLKDAKERAERRRNRARPWDEVDGLYGMAPYHGEPLNPGNIYTGLIGKGLALHRVDPRNGLTVCGKAPTQVGRRPEDRRALVTCHACLKIRH